MSAETFPSLAPSSGSSRTIRAGLWVLGVGVAAVFLAGPVNRLGLADFRIALIVLGVGTLIALVGGLTTAIGLIAGTVRRAPVPRRAAAIGLLVALGVFGYLLTWMIQARAAPTLHEISTDLEDPPEFVALKAVRAQTPDVNPTEYVAEIQGRSGPIDVPALQRKSYPDIQPLTLDVTTDEAYARARRSVKRLGWEIAAEAPAEGRIEATDTSLFFGFKDDIVVRVRMANGRSLVDVRSKSRVGLSDLGMNAARVREFLALMRKV
jgi:uncharacterized protein (DUF1499 family)